MASLQPTTSEKAVSKTREEVVKEAKRVEEGLLYSSKGHFTASRIWGNFHLIIGVPVVLLSTIAGASALTKFDENHVIASILSIIVAALSGVMTFLNPNEKEGAHRNAANSYDALMNKVRIFWAIDCWSEESDDILTSRLKAFSEQKDRLNETSPQIPRWAYLRARKGILDGEAAYAVDQSNRDTAAQ